MGDREGDWGRWGGGNGVGEMGRGALANGMLDRNAWMDSPPVERSITEFFYFVYP